MKDIHKNTEDQPEKNLEETKGQEITRKEAIKRTGYIAVSAATMMLLLNSPKANAQESSPPAAPPPWGT